MSKAETCSKCAAPRVKGQPFCATHYAEYQRDYRDRAERKRDLDNFNQGFAQGVQRAIGHLRGKVGGTVVTGFTAAVILERSYLMPLVPGVAERQKLIDSMRPLR